jgi:hypothetical protein
VTLITRIFTNFEARDELGKNSAGRNFEQKATKRTKGVINYSSFSLREVLSNRFISMFF